MPLQARTPDQAAAQAARRIAAATRRVNDAKAEGPAEAVAAIRACLLSAVKLNPSGQAPAMIDRIADYALAELRDLYQPSSAREVGR